MLDTFVSVHVLDSSNEVGIRHCLTVGQISVRAFRSFARNTMLSDWTSSRAVRAFTRTMKLEMRRNYDFFFVSMDNNNNKRHGINHAYSFIAFWLDSRKKPIRLACFSRFFGSSCKSMLSSTVEFTYKLKSSYIDLMLLSRSAQIRQMLLL